MREHGIERDDRIISVPDPSPNITLSLLDQKGVLRIFMDETMTGDERDLLFMWTKARHSWSAAVLSGWRETG